MTVTSTAGSTIIIDYNPATTDYSAELNQAASALAKTGGTILFGSGTFTFTTCPNLIPAGVRLKGAGPSTILKLVTTQSPAKFLCWGGGAIVFGTETHYDAATKTNVTTNITSLELDASVIKDVRSIKVKNTYGKVAAGDLLYIQRTRGPIVHAIALHVDTVDQDNTIHFVGRVPFDIDITLDLPADVLIYILKPAVGGGVEDMVLDGQGVTAMETYGIYSVTTTQQYFNGVRFKGWTGNPPAGKEEDEKAGGLYLSLGYENAIGDLSFYGCGSHTVTDVHINKQTALRVGQIRSELSRFGVLIQACSNSVMDSFTVTGSAVRGVKLAGCIRCTVNSAAVDAVGHTAFALAWGAMDNVVGNLTLSPSYTPNDPQDPTATVNNVGLWFSEHYNVNNLIGRVRVENDVEFHVLVPSTCTGNIIGEVLSKNTVMKIWNPGRAQFGGINGSVYRPVQGHRFGSNQGDSNAPTPSNTNLVLHEEYDLYLPNTAAEQKWTGIGCNSDGDIYFVSGSERSFVSTRARITGQPLGVSATALFLQFNNGSSAPVIKQVEVGPRDADGYRVLRIKD